MVVYAGAAVAGGGRELLGDEIVGAEGDVAELARVGEGCVVVAVECGEALALQEPADGLEEVVEAVRGREAVAEREVELWGGGGGLVDFLGRGGGFGHGGFWSRRGGVWVGG